MTDKDLIEVAARLSRAFNDVWTVEQTANWLARRGETAAHYLEESNRLIAEMQAYTPQPIPEDADTNYAYQKFLEESEAIKNMKIDITKKETK